MLASKQRSISSSGSYSEPDEVFCCGGGDMKELSGGTLERRAMLVLAGMVEGAVVTPQGPRAMSCVAAYLQGLNSRLLTAVVTAVLATRPRWLPLEYHWAPLDHDPLLYLLELLGERLTALTYTCHPLSREPLLHAIAAMPGLTTLNLPEAADDNALAVVGVACHILVTLCVRGSKAVTDDGVRRLLLRRHTYTRSRWRRLFSRWRSLRSSLTRQQARYRPLPAPLSDHTLLMPLDPEHLNPLSATLTHLDLGGTKVSNQAAEWARSVLVPHAFVEASHSQHHSLRSQTSLEDQMAKLLAPLTP
ncbi:uncharacterized protein LOC121866056 [Homarus americanus]|uniref:uncharacterized protein LOC121866056 n=1 Tax=Homarus americanus TaxID=6706 RepID=UPI001C479021|nr:uncharacterized protein LOC121866056 [Homarus americanus]XP_042221576.1 uncharacterized protein LOC121866056 [Homarus americanus]XP_042221577.1 uncharacterized protein LOC121866056 [Homarus americanus]